MVKLKMLIGVPSSGKSWIGNQIKHLYTYLPKDNYKDDESYIDAINLLSKKDTKPLLIEANFSINDLYEPLEALGYTIHPVFIIESPKVLSNRYYEREGKTIPKGHITRNNTYKERARQMNAFCGTSKEVLKLLLKENN